MILTRKNAKLCKLPSCVHDLVGEIQQLLHVVWLCPHDLVGENPHDLVTEAHLARLVARCTGHEFRRLRCNPGKATDSQTSPPCTSDAQATREREREKERRRERKTERYRETTLRTFPHDDVHAHLACHEVHLLARQQQKMAWLRRSESSTCPFWLASPTAASESGLMRACSPTPPDVCTSMCIGEFINKTLIPDLRF